MKNAKIRTLYSIKLFNYRGIRRGRPW